ncbi:ribosome-associated translation inhibitor RaiA [Sansalvadorimonas sp. 2012CJ34-2]|uniref:Ribosome hibernation promoting factor n=1 Tax=Parendozoicomonas callyspongiae TaxID=2942213 RepID=A0ABT0PBY6_9GAMM|nr:ribosome-associated translation inhibitor RaiA [Sansalvadorimonas sp. 2012CJ34-2]MCL6268895.1 ribosome-associated translation inhibitor RaiA [Sansalvadorimonas sp. 2012CJ34-2]
MQVNISGHQFEVTEALHEYVNRKLNKLASHFDGITNVQVTLSVEKQRQMAEATLHVRNADIAASSEHEDMYAAIDLLVDKLDRQLLKYKEKNIDRLQGASH